MANSAAPAVDASMYTQLSSRMQVLEAKSVGGAAVKIHNHFFTSPKDVIGFFFFNNASSVICGGFYDVHYLLSRLYRYMKGMESVMF